MANNYIVRQYGHLAMPNGKIWLGTLFEHMNEDAIWARICLKKKTEMPESEWAEYVRGQSPRHAEGTPDE